MKPPTQTALLAEVRTGVRVVGGTEWPIVDQLHRTGEREWTVTRDLCNGVARTSETYRSEQSAREAFERRLDGRKPRAGTAASERLTVRLTAGELRLVDSEVSRGTTNRSEWLREAVVEKAERARRAREGDA